MSAFINEQIYEWKMQWTNPDTFILVYSVWDKGTGKKY